jgi:hypothetical protein
MPGRVVIGFVQAQVLRLLRRRRRARHDDGLHGGGKQLGVMHVGARDLQA